MAKRCTGFKPDVISILIGVNDTETSIKQREAGSAEKFESIYRTLLEQTRIALPDSLLVLCEPFISPVGRVKDNWDNWQSETQMRQQIVSKLSVDFKAVFVPLPKRFSNASSRASSDYWIWDGIHPTVAGHDLIAQEWIKQVSKRLPFFKKLV